jgi:hypothetical protein
VSDLTEYYKVLKELQDLKTIVTSFLPEHYIDSAEKEIDDTAKLLINQKNEILMLEGAQHVMCEIMEEQQTKWISVYDRLPEEGKVVLAFGTRSSTTGMFQGTQKDHPERWHWKGNCIKHVSHWMPLPEPPKEK